MIKEIGLKKTRDKYLKSSIYRDFIEFNEAKTAGILLMKGETNQGTLQKFIKDLQGHKIEIDILEFTPKIVGKSTLANSQSVFSYKDFGFFGTNLSERLKNFTNSSFDYLFCLNTSPFLPFENILSQSKAKCRVGVLNGSNKKCFELSVGVEGKTDLSFVAEEMLRYIKQIRKN